MFKGGDVIEHCLICGDTATCDYLGSPRCEKHCTTPSIDAAAPQAPERPYERGTPLPKDAFLKDKP